MKSINNKQITQEPKGEYASIEDFVQNKLTKAAQTLKNIDLGKLSKLA